ncbi:MAG: ATP-binding protein [Candidatus Paceibacterota bacterium]|jgi:PAS domain S-box-containing protein
MEEEKDLTSNEDPKEKNLHQETEGELRHARSALLNILDDTEAARKVAVEERNKTLAIIQNFSDAILVFNENNILELINPLAEEYLGEKKENLIGKKAEDLLASPKTKLFMEFLEVSKGSPIKQVFRKEFMARPDFYLEITSLMLIMDSKMKGTLLVLHDITREKNIEKMKTEFVSISAHQLRTPLSAIKWTLRMILDEDVGGITPEQREVLQKSYASNERMINLVNDLLNVTRIEEGRFLYKLEAAQLEDLAQTSIDNLQEEIKRKGASVVLVKENFPLPSVKIDKEKMKLVLDNLIANALKYNKNKSGKVEVFMEDNEGKEIRVQVKDNGLGIPQKQQSRIFTKFFRGENVVRLEVDGSGLGLYTTKNIIEAHGGKIWFESEEGKGTSFYFTVPIKKE